MNRPRPGIDFIESGHGPTVLFVPGSYSTPAAWRPMHRLLPPRWRFVSTSLCGYGGTAETRSPDDHGMQHEVHVVEAAARAAGGPVHLVGHSFGGTVALAAALSGRVEVKSMALFEANPIDLLQRHGHAALHQAARLMSRGFEQAVREGERDAPRRIIDYWGGEGVFAAMPAAVQDYCRQTAAANVLDWHTCFGFEVSGADVARLDVPVLLVRGGLANAAMVAITDQLAAHLRDVRHEVVEGAGHFLVSSHAEVCAELLAAHLGNAA
ncbi:alpha/beta fold hydrolase [uncultured Piscinibacter sp.]|uniref:alpha/beta fold hydrolase n=1 Tax=uncultured Piscinibacter sp. TaxID=1131835 RepID=UPI002639DB4A|nr:alpha/beta fold hydrolase [uncultured Piscinibacter sp.]